MTKDEIAAEYYQRALHDAGAVTGIDADELLRRIKEAGSRVAPNPFVRLDAAQGEAGPSREALMDLLRRYREAHRSMALVAQEAGASDAYRAVTKEVDDALAS